MKYLKLKIIVILLFAIMANCHSQQITKTVEFEIYEERNQPMFGASIRVKNSNPIIETHTDISGKGKLNLTDLNIEISLSFLGPPISFMLFENVDLVKVDVKKQKIKYYSGSRILKRGKVKIEDY